MESEALIELQQKLITALEALVEELDFPAPNDLARIPIVEETYYNVQKAKADILCYNARKFLKDNQKMRTVYKYKIELSDNLTAHRMPKKAKYLTCAIQNNKIFTWFEVDTDTSFTEERVFKIVPTGGEIPHDTYYMRTPQYLGTVFQNEFVWHIYELLKKEGYDAHFKEDNSTRFV